ncbi:MAG: hypothetical protein KGH58_03925 [Candidatus Micrarchaeota archaeon]|nr:hypothetical protein [Candidatus Micrarchaeota archaeon]MDE1833539.1 hypothetical protein [Candidatus Micrarchaeota archaeon]
MEGRVKAQSAMEYLSTYGWAILVIVIVAALLYLYSSTPSTVVPTSCKFISGVYCNDIVLGTNAMTKATTVGLFLTNSQPYPMAKPYFFAKVAGANTTGTSCSPNYVLAGGSMVCVLNLPVSTTMGQFLAGNLYLNATYCGLQPNYSQANLCNTAPRQTYIGIFNSHAEPLISTNTIITLAAANATQSANGALDPLIATVTLLGYPLSGASVNFTANVPGYPLSPNFTTTNTTGKALSHISGTRTGNVLVTAAYAGEDANAVVQFVPATNVKFAVTGFPYCSTAGQIITIDGTGYTCGQLTSTTFSWGAGSVHSCVVNAIVPDTSTIRGACKTTGVYCSANSNAVITINCTPQYYLTESASPPAGGSISPGSNWYNNTTPVSISTANSVGYTFQGWAGSGTVSYTGSSNPATVTMDSPVAEQATYSLQATFFESGLAGGTSWAVTLNGNTLSTTGTSITFTGLPSGSFPWSTNAVVSCGTGCQYLASPTSGMVSTTGGSASQTVTYTPQYYLTMAAGANGAVSPSSEWQNSGNVVTITATPNANFAFSGWTGTGSGSYSGTANPSTVTMNGAVSETAAFAFQTTYNPASGNYAGDVIFSSSTTLTGAVIASNMVLVQSGVTVNENGQYLEGNILVQNVGTINDGYDGGAGGAGGTAGGTGGNGGAGGALKSMTSAYFSQMLTGGHGGNGGGGGGGDCSYCGSAYGGIGGAGGAGGGIVQIYSGNVINQGIVTVSGGNGLPGGSVSGAGGGGGGAGGGGGTILIGYGGSFTAGTLYYGKGTDAIGGTGTGGSITEGSGGSTGGGGGGQGTTIPSGSPCNEYIGGSGGNGGGGAAGGAGGVGNNCGPSSPAGGNGASGTNTNSAGQLITKSGWTP